MLTPLPPPEKEETPHEVAHITAWSAPSCVTESRGGRKRRRRRRRFSTRHKRRGRRRMVMVMVRRVRRVRRRGLVSYSRGTAPGLEMKGGVLLEVRSRRGGGEGGGGG